MRDYNQNIRIKPSLLLIRKLSHLLCALPGGVLNSEIRFVGGPIGVLGFVPPLPVKQAVAATPNGEQALRFDFRHDRFLNKSLKKMKENK